MSDRCQPISPLTTSTPGKSWRHHFAGVKRSFRQQWFTMILNHAFVHYDSYDLDHLNIDDSSIWFGPWFCQIWWPWIWNMIWSMILAIVVTMILILNHDSELRCELYFVIYDISSKVLFVKYWQALETSQNFWVKWSKCSQNQTRKLLSYTRISFHEAASASAAWLDCKNEHYCTYGNQSCLLAHPRMTQWPEQNCNSMRQTESWAKRILPWQILDTQRRICEHQQVPHTLGPIASATTIGCCKAVLQSTCLAVYKGTKRRSNSG